MKSTRSASPSGFTLIEMMVTVTVMAVRMAVAAAGLAPLLASMQLRTASYGLPGDVKLARAKALERRTTQQVAARASPREMAYGLWGKSPKAVMGTSKKR